MYKLYKIVQFWLLGGGGRIHSNNNCMMTIVNYCGLPLKIKILNIFNLYRSISWKGNIYKNRHSDR